MYNEQMIFLNTYKHLEKEVINLVNDQRDEQILENRQRLRLIIKTIFFLDRCMLIVMMDVIFIKMRKKLILLLIF